MKLQTQIPLVPQQFNQIDYHSKVFLLGSCFSENIGDIFSYYKFQSIQNPFGILFHPLAIENLFTNALNEKQYEEEDVFFHNEQWHCYEAHSKLSHVSKDDVLNNLNTNLKLTKAQIEQATHIIVTLGTAWMYRFIENDTIVANCHKVPQKQFLKELLSVDEVLQSLEAMVSLIKSVNPEVSIVFTVSPVRHLKDGFVENNQSKAHLISAIHQVVEPRKQIHYFPSYEIMLDELRDYRFYKDDLIHPNTLAINYIWDAFKKVWITPEALELADKVETIQKGLLHRPFNTQSSAHKAFLENLERKKTELHTQFPHIVF